MITKTYKYGEGMVLPTNVVKEGYDFLGWYDNSSLTGNSVSSIGINEEGDRYFYAKWNGILYQISYNLNGHGTQPSKTSYNYGEEYTPPDLTASGYSFTGWTPQKITTTTSGDIEFVAGWKSEEITGGKWTGDAFMIIPDVAATFWCRLVLEYDSSADNWSCLSATNSGTIDCTLYRTSPGYSMSLGLSTVVSAETRYYHEDYDFSDPDHDSTTISSHVVGGSAEFYWQSVE